MTLPYAKDSETSKAAAESMEPIAARQRAEVFGWLSSQPEGSTDQYGQRMISMAAQSYSPRRLELCKMGWVKDSSGREPTSSGRDATVWAVVPEEEREAAAEEWKVAKGPSRAALLREVARLRAELARLRAELATRGEEAQ